MSHHFVTGDYDKKTVFLPDREYGLALDALVKGCADVLISAGEGARLRLLLGKRRVEPQPDWWFVGGRCRPGDAPAEAAARNVKRELKLVVALERFELVGSYSFVWRLRAQAPATNGTADVSMVFELPLDDVEAAGLTPEQFDADEYETAAWKTPLEVLDGDFHPALQQAVRDLLARRALAALRDAVECDRGDQIIAQRARHYMAWKDAGPTASAKVRFNGSYRFVDEASGAEVPRPMKARPGLMPPPLPGDSDT
mmetsp:Transcript_23189/g.69461  ORF Transcript_23189/g.69461 Transcript_23189/m.69461 type:complete len:255 (+) Transcript_23189:278-1042(+)